MTRTVTFPKERRDQNREWDAGGHLRGKVRMFHPAGRGGAPLIYVEILDTRTGLVVATHSPYRTLVQAHDDAVKRTVDARDAWLEAKWAG